MNITSVVRSLTAVEKKQVHIVLITEQEEPLGYWKDALTEATRFVEVIGTLSYQEDGWRVCVPAGSVGTVHFQSEDVREVLELPALPGQSYQVTIYLLW